MSTSEREVSGRPRDVKKKTVRSSLDCSKLPRKADSAPDSGSKGKSKVRVPAKPRKKLDTSEAESKSVSMTAAEAAAAIEEKLKDVAVNQQREEEMLRKKLEGTPTRGGSLLKPPTSVKYDRSPKSESQDASPRPRSVSHPTKLVSSLTALFENGSPQVGLGPDDDGGIDVSGFGRDFETLYKEKTQECDEMKEEVARLRAALKTAELKLTGPAPAPVGPVGQGVLGEVYPSNVCSPAKPPVPPKPVALTVRAQPTAPPPALPPFPAEAASGARMSVAGPSLNPAAAVVSMPPPAVPTPRSAHVMVLNQDVRVDAPRVTPSPNSSVLSQSSDSSVASNAGSVYQAALKGAPVVEPARASVKTDVMTPVPAAGKLPTTPVRIYVRPQQTPRSAPETRSAPESRAQSPEPDAGQENVPMTPTSILRVKKPEPATEGKKTGAHSKKSVKWSSYQTVRNRTASPPPDVEMMHRARPNVNLQARIRAGLAGPPMHPAAIAAAAAAGMSPHSAAMPSPGHVAQLKQMMEAQARRAVRNSAGGSGQQDESHAAPPFPGGVPFNPAAMPMVPGPPMLGAPMLPPGVMPPVMMPGAPPPSGAPADGNHAAMGPSHMQNHPAIPNAPAGHGPGGRESSGGHPFGAPPHPHPHAHAPPPGHAPPPHGHPAGPMAAPPAPHPPHPGSHGMPPPALGMPPGFNGSLGRFNSLQRYHSPSQAQAHAAAAAAAAGRLPLRSVNETVEHDGEDGAPNGINAAWQGSLKGRAQGHAGYFSPRTHAGRADRRFHSMRE